MTVRKIVESYEQEINLTVAQPVSRPGALRPRPTSRSQVAHCPQKATNQRSQRTQRPPSLRIVKEEWPMATVLKVRSTNELHIEQGPNHSRLSVLLTPDTSYTFGQPSLTSAHPLGVLASPTTSSVWSSHPSVPPISNIPSRLALQRRAILRACRQQRYSRDESALAAALKRPAEYERIFPSKPSVHHAIKQLDARINDANAHLTEVRELIRDDTTDQATHEALLRTRWMAERWVTAAKSELSRMSTLMSRPAPQDIALPSARKTRQDANLTYFFAHSPTRTTALSTSTRRRVPVSIENPRRICKQNVEPPQLRKWPLATTLRKPMKLKVFLPTSASSTTSSEVSGVSLHLSSPPSSPIRQYLRELDLNSIVSGPSLPQLDLSTVSTASTASTYSDTLMDDTAIHTWPGFAIIYAPSHPSDEELLAAMSVDLKAEPMPEYVAYLLDQLETIGEGVVLAGLSRRGSATSSAFEIVSRPSVEVYDYPTPLRSRLLTRRSTRTRPPTRSGLGILSGLRVIREDLNLPTPTRGSTAHEQTSPRSGVFSKVRRSITVRGQQ
ncbi:hypothetical protein B0F90DRAFT_1127382 [Multifurca ochricompacta]|uniref:Uncharacterized protein n=1 Tax=Multifurca ochricompacta TaxID=376703 RepID=A0AAD4LZM5_9AGAM|nr:hypothetical protein B0F90DRAFT_1127382 [Multifurca ochricompacta]